MIITQVRCYLFKRIMLETLVIITINIILRLIIVYTQTQVCPFCLFPYVFLQSGVTLTRSDISNFWVSHLDGKVQDIRASFKKCENQVFHQVVGAAEHIPGLT